MMGESAPANNVIVPWNTATGRAEKMQPRPSDAVMVQTMMQSNAPFKASVDQVTEQTVLNRAHDGHGADAHRERCRDKGVGELVVTLAAGFSLEPFAKVLDGGLQVDGLADERTEGK